MPPTNKYVFFDFDGVIADSFALAFDVARTMHPHFTEETYREAFGVNVFERDIPCTSACRTDQKDFYDLFSSRLSEIKIFPGAKEAVESLGREYTLCIISSSVSMDIVATLRVFGLGSHFTDVFGKDVHQSKIEKINMLLSRYATTPEHCIFITDTLGDMNEARRVGMDSIGVSWGFQGKETLTLGKPFRIVDTPAHIVSAVDEYFRTSAHAQ